MTDEFYNIAFDCIDRRALLTPNQTALRFVSDLTNPDSDIPLDFETLRRKTNQCARFLLDLNLAKHHAVLIQMGNQPEFPIVFFGAMKAGLLPIPVSEKLTPIELQKLQQISQSEVWFSSNTDKNRNEASFKHEFLVKTWHRDNKNNLNSLITPFSDNQADLKTNPNDPAFGLFTSGTTGEPKTVIHAHRCIPAHDKRTKEWMRVSDGDTLLNTSQLNWSYSLTCALMNTLRNGCSSVFFQGTPSLTELNTMVSRYNISTVMTVPGLLRRWNKSGSKRPKEVKTWNSAGEKLDTPTKTSLTKNLPGDLFEGLGMSECSVYVFETNPSTEAQLVINSTGKISDTEDIKTLKASSENVEDAEELAIHKNFQGLMLGYGTWNSQKLEIELPLSDDWFFSGDLVQESEDGSISYLSRKDDLITSGGYRVSPLEIETVINCHPDILESMVFSAVFGQKTLIYAFLVPESPKTDPETLVSSIELHLNESLASYKHPKKLCIKTCLPRTPNGKLKRTPKTHRTLTKQ